MTSDWITVVSWIEKKNIFFILRFCFFLTILFKLDCCANLWVQEILTYKSAFAKEKILDCHHTIKSFLLSNWRHHTCNFCQLHKCMQSAMCHVSRAEKVLQRTFCYMLWKFLSLEILNTISKISEHRNQPNFHV